MTLGQAVISGIVQGVTEFLPVSSSGHLVMLHTFFKIKEPTLAFDVFLHMGTLCAVIIYFWNDIAKIIFKDKEQIIKILIATMPAAVAAIIFGEKIELLFSNAKYVFFMLLVTGLWLLLGSIALGFGKKSNNTSVSKNPNAFVAFLIGTAQAVALIPGISRSGSTISTALMLGVEEQSAFRFSFLLSIPAVLGAFAYKFKKEFPLTLGPQKVAYVAGALSALVVGLVALNFLSRILKQKKFIYFSAYCFIVGISGLLLLYL